MSEDDPTALRHALSAVKDGVLGGAIFGRLNTLFNLHRELRDELKRQGAMLEVVARMFVVCRETEKRLIGLEKENERMRRIIAKAQDRFHELGLPGVKYGE